MSLVLTSFHSFVNHYVDHVLHVCEALLLEMTDDLSYEFFLRPDEQDTFLHDSSWDFNPLEVIDGDTLECTSVVGETLLVQLLFFLRILDKALALGRRLVRLL